MVIATPCHAHWGESRNCAGWKQVLNNSAVMSAASRFVESKIRQRKVMMFTKSRDPACELALRSLESYKMPHDVFEVCEIDRRHDCSGIESHFLVICLASQRAVRKSYIVCWESSFIPGLKTSFSANPSHRSSLFLFFFSSRLRPPPLLGDRPTPPRYSITLA